MKQVPALMLFLKRSKSFPVILPLAGFLFAGISPSQTPNQAGGQAIRVRVEMVSLAVVVTAGDGKCVTDLTKDDFQVFEDDVRQKIAAFTAVDEPFSIAMMLDTSGSTTQELRQIRREAIRFTRLLPGQDSVAVFSFGENVTLLENFTSDQRRMASAIERVRPGGYTGLYDAVRQGIQEVLQSRQERCALVLFTDGLDTASEQATGAATREMAKQSRGPIYSIYFNTRDDRQGLQYLKDIADNSGGMVIEAAGVRNLNAAFKAIARELTSQYSIGYYPINRSHDGKYRKIELKVNRSDLRVQTRKGYWAPGEDRR
jgi:Ca-activated chloride channel family protein